MKLFKYLFFLLLIICIGGSIYVATIDGDFQAEDSLVIQAPAELLYSEIIDLKTWEKWGPWKKQDPNIVMQYPEKTNGVGASYSWNGDKTPDGTIKTVDAIANTSIEQSLIIDTAMGTATQTMYWSFETVDTGTKVTWGIKGKHSFKDKAYWATKDQSYTDAIRPMFLNGLKGLDSVMQKKMSAYTISVDGVTVHSGGFYMYNSTASSISNVGAKMAQMMPNVFNYMQSNAIPMTGSPMTIYNEWDLGNNTTIFSSAIPTSNRVITPYGSPILCGYMPTQSVVKTTLKGDYKYLQEAWTAAQNYIEENTLEKDLNAKDFEIYRTDPGTTQNPADWVTEIYIPVKSTPN